MNVLTLLLLSLLLSLFTLLLTLLLLSLLLSLFSLLLTLLLMVLLRVRHFVANHIT
jgi:hypothetical protein